MSGIERRSEQCPGCGRPREVRVTLVEEGMDYDAIEILTSWTAPCPEPTCPTNEPR
jgi:hypothetical protein